MKSVTHTEPLAANAVPAQHPKTGYPLPFSLQVDGREKRRLGDFFGLQNFGVNLTTLAPGAVSALAHAHSRQDEFIYVLEGEPTLIIDDAEFALAPGQCIGFRAGSGQGHQLINRSESTVTLLEIGDRTKADEVVYPNDDLRADLDASGRWVFRHKDGSPY
jgi:uncharacterized cupin superfamily protein